MTRVPPSEQKQAGWLEMLSQLVDLRNPKTELVLMAIRQFLEELLEAAVRDLLGRGSYERRSEEQQGYRNGYRTGRLKSSEGEVEYRVPQVRDVDSSSLGQLRDVLKGRTEALEALGLEMYARGLSTRDIEAVLRDEQGRLLLSRTAVTEVTEALWKQYEAFCQRDLSDFDVLYLYLDGVAERLYSGGARTEMILCAWAVLRSGRKVLIHLAPGTKESTDCCRAFLQDLTRRGLPDPVLVITDGAPGLIRAVEECFPASLRQRCLVHKMRNLGARCPQHLLEEVKSLARAVYQSPNAEQARYLAASFRSRFEEKHPKLVECFEEDFEACIAHLRCPPAHHRAIRTTNTLERLFREERRRIRAAIPTLGERPVLKLMFATMIRAAEGWKGIQIKPLELKQLDRLRQELQQQVLRDNAPVYEAKTRSTPEPVYSTFGT